MRHLHSFVISTSEDDATAGEGWPIELIFGMADRDNEDLHVWLPHDPDEFLDWMAEHAPQAEFFVRINEADAECHRAEVVIADENAALAYRMRWPEPLE
ncbi:hypothetical protein [Methylobacterium radiodurans]|nr:hypothetical protein [Methylobacterium radiodurans]